MKVRRTQPPRIFPPPKPDFSTSDLAVRPVRLSSFSSEPAFRVTFPQALHSGCRDLPEKLLPIGALQGASGGRIGRCGVYLDPRTEPKPCDNNISSLRKNFSSPARFSPKCYKWSNSHMHGEYQACYNWSVVNKSVLLHFRNASAFLPQAVHTAFLFTNKYISWNSVPTPWQWLGDHAANGVIETTFVRTYN